jgi:hypothetical protein
LLWNRLSSKSLWSIGNNASRCAVVRACVLVCVRVRLCACLCARACVRVLVRVSACTCLRWRAFMRACMHAIMFASTRVRMLRAVQELEEDKERHEAEIMRHASHCVLRCNMLRRVAPQRNTTQQSSPHWPHW